MSKWSSAYRDSRWQQKRLEVFNRDKWACRSCGATGEGVELHVHHEYYENRPPWDYPSETLKTLCSECHREITESKRVVARIVSASNGVNAKQLAAICFGLSLVADIESDALPDINQLTTQELIPVAERIIAVMKGGAI
jgi:antitoxin (DNA-binding transcriptional repressor) of toxin-antitoxin stability system